MKLTDLHNLSSGRLEALRKNGIHTVGDLLFFFPRRYIDKTVIRPIRLLSETDEHVTVVGKVTGIREEGFRNKKRLEVIIQDETDSLKGVWFRGTSYFKKIFKEGQVLAFYGTPRRYGRSLSMAHPEVDQLDSKAGQAQLKKIIPIYPGSKEFSKARITNKLIAGWIDQILNKTKPKEFLPLYIREELNLPAREDAIESIHRPKNLKEAQDALERFKFEELFLFELSMARIKKMNQKRAAGHIFENVGPLTKKFFTENLPFKLTGGQKDALRDIRKDLKSSLQMTRLIQGDVGSGKTVVAAGTILMAVDNGFQAAFMAPTEILAEQHYRTLTAFFKELDVEVRLLTGKQKTKLKQDVLTSVEGGQCDIVIGTHAVIQGGVNFHKLGLAVIDEQHRFGVKQRTRILQKGDHPHLLVMSATPIPRSLAMTIYSDLDISLIKELPAGRKPVKTAIRTERKRKDLYGFLYTNIKEGGQVYFVYPLIEESEVMDLKDATIGFEKLKKHFPDFKIGLLHGQLKSEEKEEVMGRFSSGDLDILVSTTVIEVGVDVPNANVMVIEHAERFGLSQLHQLRGRIGRGSRQSYCILIPGQKISRDGRYRLQKMVETNDGFEIAEADLKLRGPGDFLGTKQSGLPDFKYADIVEDQFLLAQAKNYAWNVIKKDPQLGTFEDLKSVFEPYFKKKSEFFESG